ncbi:MAG: hypothetical protein ACXVHB_31200 [Solirubrobacteraceae bacterium]
MEAGLDRRRRRLCPQLLDQLVARDRLVRMHEQEREQGALLRTAERQDSVVHAQLERAEDPELDRHLRLLQATVSRR